MNDVRIIFISRYQGQAERGVENYTAQLASQLVRLGYETEILTSFWQLIGKRADIIYPLNGSWQALGCRLYAWITGAKLVVGGHAGIGKDDGWNLYMLPDLFIAFSQKGYEWAKKVNPFVKIIKIHHGVNFDEFNPKVKPTPISLQRPIFIAVSHLDPYKRIAETVKAVAELKQGSLLVLGDGRQSQKVDMLGEKLLNNSAKQKRYLRLQVSHREVAGYLRAADVFTLASESSEAFGLVYLEALACNLPVVATDDSLRREIIDTGGVFVKNPEDSREYAKCLEAAAKADWGDKPVKQAKKFDWNKIAQEYDDIFTKLII